MKNIINKYIGIFDFWGIFCVGIVILTSFVVLIGQNIFNFNADNFTIFLYKVIAYVLGLILHSLSSTLIDCGLLIFNTDKVLTADYEKRFLLKK